MADRLAQAVLLLTAHLGKTSPGQAKPLGPAEYGRFAQWLQEHDLSPERLLLDDPGRVLAGWSDQRITLDRIRSLLDRSAALGLALEKWERAGLWVITRGDSEYPVRLKKHLARESPPALIGCGNRTLLNAGGVAVVGSRDATESEMLFAAKMGKKAAREEVCIVSGGAAGIDESAMLAALHGNGVAVGVLADRLIRAATSTRYRDSLIAGHLALVSPFNPEAGFDVGNAMARNRYIYCLADAAVVITATEGKGGTWNGAIQNLKEGWVPLWVKPAADAGSGNAALVARGALSLPDGEFRLSDLWAGEATGRNLARAAGEAMPMSGAASSEPKRGRGPAVAQIESGVDGPDVEKADSFADVDFYSLFLVRVERLLHQSSATPEQMAESLDLHKSQLSLWLQRAVTDGRLTKLSKPVRYVWNPRGSSQPALFSDAR